MSRFIRTFLTNYSYATPLHLLLISFVMVVLMQLVMIQLLSSEHILFLLSTTNTPVHLLNFCLFFFLLVKYACCKSHEHFGDSMYFVSAYTK